MSAFGGEVYAGNLVLIKFPEVHWPYDVSDA